MNLYHTTPPQEIFDDIKQVAVKIWNTYDDQFGYATEKIDRINAIQNYADNYATIIGMFDNYNQTFLVELVNQDTRDYFAKLWKEGLFALHPYSMDSIWMEDVPADDPRWKLLS